MVSFLQELDQIRDGCELGDLRDFVDGEIKYFTDNQSRMRCDIYRAAKLPICSGSIVMRTRRGITQFSECR